MKPIANLSGVLRGSLLILMLVGGPYGCEAPLNLQGVANEQARKIHRFDQFKGVAASADYVVVAADGGVLLRAARQSQDWQRVQLPTQASFINLAACPDGRFVALDNRRTLWLSDINAASWVGRPVDTQETLMGLACGKDGAVWVGASFSTILHSKDFGKTWTAQSQDEDLLFTALQVFDDGTVVAAGEFGTLMRSTDAGESWKRAEPMPNEFYPLGMYFRDRMEGWVSGLSGTVLYTGDGGMHWTAEPTATDRPIYNFASDGKRLFATGDNGALLERVHGRWESVGGNADVATYLIGAVAIDTDNLLAAGGAGHLLNVQIEKQVATGGSR